MTKKILEDVVLMRVVLIVLLVLYHSFAIFNGAWEGLAGYPDIHIYWWIATFSYSFMLEAFVFISGYVFGYQVRHYGNEMLSFDHLIVPKIKRLLLPGLFFSVLYYLLFYDIHKPIGEVIYSILNGCGHLWFLPMLFWCFVGIYVIEKIKLRGKLLYQYFGKFLPKI